MSLRGQTVFALVPARGGSKGIPGKNLRTVGGLSLVARAAAVAAALPDLDRAILSTDSEEIATAGRAAGLLVPSLRPPELASDTAKSVDVWRHAWLEMEQIDGRRYDLSILLEPTSPLRRPEDVTRTLLAMLDAGAAAAVTVSAMPAHVTPHKTLTIDAGERIGFFLTGGEAFSRRQDIPPLYHRNGLCYAVRRSTVVEERRIIERDCVAVPIERRVVNIDEPIDLDLAELLLARETAEAASDTPARTRFP